MRSRSFTARQTLGALEQARNASNAMRFSLCCGRNFQSAALTNAHASPTYLSFAPAESLSSASSQLVCITAWVVQLTKKRTLFQSCTGACS